MFALVNAIANGNHHAIKMREKGDIAVLVGQAHKSSIAGRVARGYYSARFWRDNGRANWNGDVYAVVKLASVCNWIRANAAWR